ncbi:MAG TPA: ATP-binding protein [Treponemataceae bacterium]|nr:ATP-binding protein [Treponemataceae bacterium]
MRKHHRYDGIVYRYQFLSARIVFTLISIPFLVIVFELFRGPTIALATSHVAEIIVSRPFIGFFWINCLILSACILLYLKPAIKLYCPASRQCARASDARLAIKRLNKLHLIVIALSTVGFFGGDVCDLLASEAAMRAHEVARHVILLKSLSKGLLCGTLISFNLENLFFPAKKAALELYPKAKIRKTSLYRRVAFIVAVLLFFIIMQISSVVSESFARVDEAGNIVLSGRSVAEFYAPDADHDEDDERGALSIEHEPDGHGTARVSVTVRSPSKLEDIVSVLDVKIALFCLFAFMLLLQIKRMIRFPVESMRDRLETLNSGDVSSVKAIDVLNNDEFAGVLNEVNALIRKQQSELERSSNRLEEIVARAADPIVAFTRDGKIEVFNPAAERFFGYAASEVERLSLIDLIELPREEGEPCAECSSTEELIDRLYAGEVGIKRFMGVRKDGARVPFESNVSVERADDAVIYTAILRDVAKQVAAEEHLREARVAAENANRLKSEFLANMSHELRTPLNAVLGFTQLLSTDRNLTPGQLEKIGIISRSGEHLLSLINDILDISKIEAGKTELHETVFSPTRFVEDVREMFELRCKKAGLGFYVEYSNPLPERVKGDLGKLRQIMINLVGNAVKFTSEGGIGILVGLESGKLRFAVTDTGKGIPKDELKAIMEPFIQSSITDNEGGTGLGLAISSRYVRMMGGELSVESELGKGSTFSFAVELPETDEALRDSGDGPVAIAVKKGTEVTALIVDDKELNRLVLKEMLETAGFSAIEAENGKVACERAAEVRPDLIFMDIKMPVMDGYAAVKALKENPETREIPVFALTASAFANDERRILESGFDGFLAKPFKRSDLFALIRDKSRVELEYEAPARKATESVPDPARVDFARAARALGKDGVERLSGYALINDFTAIEGLARELEGKAPDFAALLAFHAGSFDEAAFEGILSSLAGAESGA